MKLWLEVGAEERGTTCAHLCPPMPTEQEEQCFLSAGGWDCRVLAGYQSAPGISPASSGFWRWLYLVTGPGTVGQPWPRLSLSKEMKRIPRAGLNTSEKDSWADLQRNRGSSKACCTDPLAPQNLTSRYKGPSSKIQQTSGNLS